MAFQKVAGPCGPATSADRLLKTMLADATHDFGREQGEPRFLIATAAQQSFLTAC
jgi:hypothetical protein